MGNLGRGPFGEPVRQPRTAVELVHLLEDAGYTGNRPFNAHAYRTEDYEGVKDVARGCMRTYLILKEKARQWNADPEIQALIREINADSGNLLAGSGGYSADKSGTLQNRSVGRRALRVRGRPYERFDRLTVELVLGVRQVKPAHPLQRATTRRAAICTAGRGQSTADQSTGELPRRKSLCIIYHSLRTSNYAHTVKFTEQIYNR